VPRRGRLRIGVIGEGVCGRRTAAQAERVGRAIAEAGAVLLCGGLGGVMESACKGAKENGGTTVGIIPQEEFSFANQYCDIVVCTGIGYARDFIVASSADAIVAVGGGVGTLIELGVGYMTKKFIVVIAGSGGVADMYGGKFLDDRQCVPIRLAKDARIAIQIILAGNK